MSQRESFTTRFAGDTEDTEKRIFPPFVRLRINSGAKAQSKGLRARGFNTLFCSYAYGF
ncbi:MAG TPA: hypothetical protein PK514_15755 [Spirochaetota bacterium]|nr:hypothetical protein [Spirochaetota bacterium]